MGWHWRVIAELKKNVALEVEVWARPREHALLEKDEPSPVTESRGQQTKKGQPDCSLHQALEVVDWLKEREQGQDQFQRISCVQPATCSEDKTYMGSENTNTMPS